jgi:hypothetical protein
LVSAGERFLMSAEIAEAGEDRLGFPGIAHFWRSFLAGGAAEARYFLIISISLILF